MGEIKKLAFGNLIEVFDPNEKSTEEFEILNGKFSVEDLIYFYDWGFEIWALENFSYSGRVIMKTGEKLVKRHLKIMKECRGKFIIAKLKRKSEKLNPDVFKLISTYKSIQKDAIINYPLVNLNESNLPTAKKEEIKKALSKKYHDSRKQMIELFNRNSKAKIKPHEPIFKSEAICTTDMKEKEESDPEKVIIAIDVSGSTVIDNLNYFLQYLGRQVKNYIENVLEIPLEVIFFDHELIPLIKGKSIDNFGGAVYQKPFEYCLNESKKSNVDFILLSDGMPNDDVTAKNLAKKFKENGISYYQIIVLHPMSSTMHSYDQGTLPFLKSDDSYFKSCVKTFEEICKNAGGSQMVVQFPEFLYYMIVDFYEDPVC